MQSYASLREERKEKVKTRGKYRESAGRRHGKKSGNAPERKSRGRKSRQM